MASANGRYGTTGRTSGKPADIAPPAEDRETKRRRLADGGRRPGEVLLPEDLAMPPPEPPPPTPSQPESSSNGQSEPNNEKERIHLRLRGAAPALMDLHKAFGTEPRKSDEPPADQNTIRFAYQAVASHLRPLIRDRCSYHIIDDAAALELLSTLPPELKPSEGAELRLADMRLTDGEYELQPHLQRWRDICEEAELWDDKTIISTVLRGGRYQALTLALALSLALSLALGLALILALTVAVSLPQPYQVLGFRAILQTRGQGVDGGCLFRVLWQPEARRPVLNTHARSRSLTLPSPLSRNKSRSPSPN